MAQLRADLAETRAERDAALLAERNLRAWVCMKLGIIRRTPGPEGLTLLRMVSDREIVEEIERLTARAAGADPDQGESDGQAER